MTDKTNLEPGDEVVTLSDDGKTSEIKKAPTAEELKADKAKASAAEEDDGDDQDEDQRHAVGSDENPEDAEKRRLARKEARKARKDHRRQREADKDATITALNERLAALEGKVGSVESSNANQTIAIVDTRIAEASQARDLADGAIEAAVTKQDGKAMREAMKARDLAIEALRQLSTYKTQYEAQVKNQGQQGQPKGPDPALVNHARRFKADNPWIEFDPAKSDADSKVAHELDLSVLRAGYDPTTQAYWDELQDRIDRRFPSKLADMADDAEEEDAGATRRSNGQAKGAGRRGPPTGGGRSSVHLGKNDAVVTADEKRLIQQAGYWDNPKDRADMVKRLRASKEKYGAAR